MKVLVYTILVGRAEFYVPMFHLMVDSLGRRIPSGLESHTDLLVIGNKVCLSMLLATSGKRPQGFSAVHALEVPTEPDLHDALLRKLDIVDVKDVTHYDVVLYLDCDILVQKPLARLLHTAWKSSNVVFHMAHESEDINHPFFGFQRYSEADKERFRRSGASTFNNGTYLFRPTPEALGHMRALRAFAQSRPDLRASHYDQSFYNHYMNFMGSTAEGPKRKRLVSTDLLRKRVIIFPKRGHQYPRATFVHFAGLGSHERKLHHMREYIQAQY